MAAPKKKAAPTYQISGESRRIIPLNEGRHAYVRDHLGKLHHLATDTQAFYDLLSDLDAPDQLNGRITNELTALGWTHVLDVLYPTNPTKETIPA